MQIKTTTGFTLIELLVVIIIASVLVGAITVSFNRNPQDEVKKEAQRLQALVNVLRDEAIVQSRQYALGFSTSGYRFFQRNNETWIAVKADRLLRSRKVLAEIATRLYLEGEEIVIEKDNKKVKPQVFVLSSGEMTPFVYQLQYPGYSAIKVNFDALGNGKIELENERS